MILNNDDTSKREYLLRCHQDKTKQRLWRQLRYGKLGCKFNRQHRMGDYMADFYCPEKNLVVEVDGPLHYTEEGLASDKWRSAFWEVHGIKVIRFTNREVWQELDKVLTEIRKELSIVSIQFQPDSYAGYQY